MQKTTILTLRGTEEQKTLLKEFAYQARMSINEFVLSKIGFLGQKANDTADEAIDRVYESRQQSLKSTPTGQNCNA